MKKRSILILLLIYFLYVYSGAWAEEFRHPMAHPKLTIIKVARDLKEPQLLAITLQIESNGTGPIALSQDQLTVHIATKEKPYLLVGDVVFPQEAPKIFQVLSGQSITWTLKVDRDSAEENENMSWTSLPKGVYELRVYVNSGKSQKFEYQWLGQTYSNTWNLRVPITAEPNASVDAK